MKAAGFRCRSVWLLSAYATTTDPWLILSAALGVANHVTTPDWWWSWRPATLEYVILGFSALWLAVFIAGLVVHGWRGLWLLISAPLALRWPLFIVVLLYTGDLTAEVGASDRN
jgi:hypothetical protein